mmetsp:Transcript_2715/g.4929  ORF Transcript_2715/g.4929 Transcript_2715/m.4929 type:complete len:336 (-) Transcript_2715:166-1173(-)
MLTPQVANVVAYYFNVLIAYGIGAQSSTISDKLSLKTNKQISEMYPTLITPAGYSFSIWGLIFILEAISICWQFTLTDNASDSPHLHGKIPFIFQEGSRYWVLTCVLQCIWTLTFGWNKILISTGVMMGLFYTIVSTYMANLIALQTRLTSADVSSEGYAYFWAVLPFALHSSWLLVATLVEFNIFVVSRKASASLQVIIALLSLTTILLLGCYAAGSLLGTIGYARSLESLDEIHIGCRVTLLMVLLWAARAIQCFDNELNYVTAGIGKKDDDQSTGSVAKGNVSNSLTVELVPLSRLQTIVMQRFKGVVYRTLLGAFLGNFVLFAVKYYQLMQ